MISWPLEITPYPEGREYAYRINIESDTYGFEQYERKVFAPAINENQDIQEAVKKAEEAIKAIPALDDLSLADSEIIYLAQDGSKRTFSWWFRESYSEYR